MLAKDFLLPGESLIMDSKKNMDYFFMSNQGDLEDFSVALTSFREDEIQGFVVFCNRPETLDCLKKKLLSLGF